MGKKNPTDGEASGVFVLNYDCLESELVTNREHEYAVVALRAALVVLEGICQTPVVASVDDEALVLVRDANGNRQVNLVAIILVVSIKIDTTIRITYA